jgi:hypothetical protein
LWLTGFEIFATHLSSAAKKGILLRQGSCSLNFHLISICLQPHHLDVTSICLQTQHLSTPTLLEMAAPCIRA